jgi:hypothetical protein
MAQTSWPFENIDTNETQFSQWARHIGEGVARDIGGELEVVGDSSGMNVKVAAGEAMVRGHYYKSTAEETLTIPLADLANDRIDLVVLELDPVDNSILLKVLQGDPDPSPVAPTPTQTVGDIYQLPVAEVEVSAAVALIAPENVTDLRGYIDDIDVTIASIDGLQAALDGKSPLAGSTSITTVGTVTTATSPTAAGSTGLRKITISTSAPTGGADGDVWLKYE